MPLRAFIDSDEVPKSVAEEYFNVVLMPLRAFIDSDSVPESNWFRASFTGLNALTGIY